MKKIVILMAISAIIAGCSKKDEAKKKEAPKVASVEERMADKEYVGELKKLSEIQKKIAKKYNSATNDEDRAAAAAELEALRQESLRHIRERMQAK